MKDLEFISRAGPPPEICETLARSQPLNPFCTSAYLAARRRSGAAVWLLGLGFGGELVRGCAAFLSTGRLNQDLDIESLPAMGTGSGAFAAGLAAFCGQQGVSRLLLSTFGSPAGSLVPALPGEISRTARQEFLLDLTTADLWSSLSSNHKRRIKAAEKAGVEIRIAAGPQAVARHVQLIDASFERRRDRGEAIPEQTDPSWIAALLESGAGRIHQATLANDVLSSILILRSAAAGYYHSAGTSPEGMSLGASHLLVHEVAKTLQGESLELFNLGGVSEDNPGLVRFKSSFGARPVELEAAEFYVGPAWKKAMSSMATMVRRGSSTIRKLSSAKS